MVMNIANAAAAYAKAAGGSSIGGVGGIGSLGGQGAAAGSGFADVLREATQGAIEAQRQGETMSMKAAAGKADLNAVVNAVTNAEMTLQTVVAVRDRVVAAYQDILRMPI
jgi:flagellar hook-basal body complex protein FliE